MGKDIDIEHVCVCVNATQLTVAEDLIDDSKSGDTVTFMYWFNSSVHLYIGKSCCDITK